MADVRDTTALKPQFDRAHLNSQFIRAAEDGDFARLKELHAEGASINAIGPKGKSALSHAVARGDNEMTDWLLAEKISADHPDDDGNTPLHHATHGKSGYCVKAVLKAVTIHDAKNSRGETPAILAVVNGTPSMMEDIIRAGADANQRDPDGSPLVVIAQALQADAKVETLLSLGANPGLEGRRGKTLDLTDTVLDRYCHVLSHGTAKPLTKRKSISFG